LNRKLQVDCLGLGIVPFDILFSVKKYPEAEMKIDAEKLFMQGGGPVPTVLCGLSRLGLKTSLLAAFGEDVFGRQGVKELRSEQVDVSNIVWKKRNSDLATGWIESGSGRRTMVLSRELTVDPKDIILKNLPMPKVVHLDGRDLKASQKLARWAKKNNVIVSFDIGSIRNDVSSLFKYVDHLVVADSYAFPFTRKKTAKSAIVELRKYCSGTIVITEGTSGSLGFEDGNYIRQCAYKVQTIDRTGAGDAFHVGYIYGLLNCNSLKERLHLGAAVASLKCMKPGARTGLPNRSTLKKFINSNLKVIR